jgi:hypothetical protein
MQIGSQMKLKETMMQNKTRRTRMREKHKNKTMKFVEIITK